MVGVRKTPTDLPSRLYAREGKRRTSYYTVTKDNKYMGLGANYLRAVEKLNELHKFEFKDAGATAAQTALASELWRRSYKSAKERDMPFELTKADVMDMVRNSGGVCAVTGAKFSDAKVEGRRVRPYRASVDRINPKLGYTRENTRLVCVIANIAMNQFGEGALLGLLSGLLDNHRQKR